MSRLRATYRVHNLLAAVESEAVLQQAAHDRRRRYACKRRWDHALLTLHEHGWQLTFDPTTYPMALRPDWTQPATTPAHLRQLPVGYWRLLLGARITLIPPEPIPDLLAAGTEPPARQAPPLAPPPLGGSQVRQAREAKGWSQRQLAALLGKSQTWVALVEQGQRQIPPRDRAQLQHVLGSDV